jgi:hypothetical protein
MGAPEIGVPSGHTGRSSMYCCMDFILKDLGDSVLEELGSISPVVV